MSDIKLFRLKKDGVEEFEASSVSLEKSLQTLIEKNLETLLGVCFLETEYSTGKSHGGRIDTLGIDENGCPVIIEYKRATNENVINQGLFYLDWLLDHKAEYKLLVMEKLGKKEIAYSPINPHPLSTMKTELVWEGKYDEYGKKRELNIPVLSMPMQKIETVDQPRSEAAAKNELALFEKSNKRKDDFRNNYAAHQEKKLTDKESAKTILTLK